MGEHYTRNTEINATKEAPPNPFFVRLKAAHPTKPRPLHPKTLPPCEYREVTATSTSKKKLDPYSAPC